MNQLQIKKATSLSEIRVVAKNEAENDLSLLNAAEILVNIKKLETFLEEYKSNVRALGIDELDRVTECNGFLITKGETVRYDYSNDAEWNERKKVLEFYAKQVKDREKFLKGLKEPFTQVDEETGETVRIYPPSRTGADRITITEIQ